MHSARTRAVLAYLAKDCPEYFNIRVIEDEVIIACRDMLFTTAVCLNLNMTGFESRICYPSKQQAVACCNSLTNMDDAPLPGFTALK